MNTINFILNTLINDAPEPWRYGIQDPASPAAEGLTELHDVIMFYVLVIGIGVTWVIANIIQAFRIKVSPISHRYYNHGTIVELVWTITPAAVLMAIAFPSFRLLYLFDTLQNIVNLLLISMLRICKR